MIDSFTGEYSFLSNFYHHPFTLDGEEYPSAEYAYQMAKTLDETEKFSIAVQSYSGLAKKAGRKVTLRPDWDAKWKYVEMMRILHAKFDDPWMMGQLQDTNGAVLVEGNNWHDNVWGVCRCAKCGGSGKNMLGIFLMMIRDGI